MLTAMGLHSDATATAANSAGALAANAPPSTSPAPPETTDAPLSPEPTVASQPTMESPTPPDSLPNPGIIANMASDAEVTTPDGQPYAAATSAATRTDMAVPVHVSPAFLAKTGSHDPKDPTLFRNRIGADRIHGGSSQRYLHVPERTAMANPASDTPDAFPASGASATQGSAPTPAHLRHQAQRAYQQQHAPSVPADPFADFLKDPEFSARIKTNIEQQLSAMDAERMREQALAAYQQDDAI